MGQRTNLGAKSPSEPCLDPSHLFIGFNSISWHGPRFPALFVFLPNPKPYKGPQLFFPWLSPDFLLFHWMLISFPAPPPTTFLSLLQILPASFLGTEGKDKIGWQFPAMERKTLFPSTRAMMLNTHPIKVKAQTAPSCQDPSGTDSSITGAFGSEAHGRSWSVTGILWQPQGQVQTAGRAACPGLGCCTFAHVASST